MICDTQPTIFLTPSDIFSLDVQAIVNPVNCLGVMGSGLALSFRKRFPDMFHEYKKLCSQKQICIGHMHMWETNSLTNPKFVINFPTKDDRKQPSELRYIEEGLESLVVLIYEKSISSIAIPKLGCGRGGLHWADVCPIIHRKLYIGLKIPTKIIVCF